MILVDTSVWANYFNGRDDPWVRHLDAALAMERDLGVLPIIITEVLQGFRTDRGFRSAQQILRALPLIQPDVGVHVRAAGLFRELRRSGATVRGAIDCVIGQTCIELRATLLSRDRDFLRIADHTALDLWMPGDGP